MAALSHTGETPSPAIELRGVTKQRARPNGPSLTALRDVSLTVQPGEFCAIVGPTGCGKSTILSLIAGLEGPSSGTALVAGEPVGAVASGVAFMFQQDAIFPWKTVRDNIAAGLRFRGCPRAEAYIASADWVRRVGLSGFEDHYPHQLSGGMRKRVALAQNLITAPQVLLMDEPFSALDVQTRAFMADELLTLWQARRPAVVFVTHDLEEAITLADKVVVLTASPGTVKAVHRVELPRPREAQSIRFDPAFIQIYQRIWESLRAEVAEAYARGNAQAVP